MPESKHVPPIALLIAALILAVSPDSFAASIGFISALALFGFTQWLETKKQTVNQSLEAQVKDIRTRLDDLILGRSLGR